MNGTLKRLGDYARQMISLETYDEYLQILPGGLERNVEIVQPEIDLAALERVVAEGMNRYEPGDTASDAWLAPRVHATLRLTRRAASDPGIWDYLSAVELRDYVKWRWGDANGTITQEYRIRITSRNREIRHALWRLWWVAELSRNGSDYGPTLEAFAKQDTVEWFVVFALHNRPTAQAFLRFLSTRNDGVWATGQQIKDFAKALDHALTTFALDSIAEDPGPDLTAVYNWIQAKPDPTLMFDRLPEGPNDPIEEVKIESALELMERVYGGMADGQSQNQVAA